jgi:hypothetical protein
VIKDKVISHAKLSVPGPPTSFGPTNTNVIGQIIIAEWNEKERSKLALVVIDQQRPS